LKIDTTSFFSAEGGPIWIKFCSLVQNDMSTAVIWSKSKPECGSRNGGRLNEFHCMLSQSHLPHCRVLPLGEFTVMIPEPHATLKGAVTWRNQCHDCATLQGVIIPSAILKIVFRHILFLPGGLREAQPCRYCFYSVVVQNGFFAPQGRHVAPINVKFGTGEQTDRRVRPRAKFHVYGGIHVGIQPREMSKFQILAINLSVAPSGETTDRIKKS